ncbi:MAG: efflux RND transporter periplasmic adaptor subunit [Halioglobus sp.]
MVLTAVDRDHTNSRVTSAAAIVCAAALCIGVTFLLYARAGFSETADVRSPMPVVTQTYLISDSYSRELPFLGLVRAGLKTDLGFEVPGLLASLAVREGSAVSAGQAIAQLDTAQLEARLDAAIADRDRVQAELELAELKARRQRDLRDSGAVSKEAFDETRLSAKALTAQLQSVNAQMRSIQINLENSTLVAPYNGVVAARYVNRGTVISPGMPVLTIVSIGEREAHIGVSARRAASLKTDTLYSLSLRGQLVSARLRSIRPDVDPVTLTTTAVFDLPADTVALDGEPISLTLTEQVDSRGGWLPISALIEGERGIWNVYRLEQAGSSTITVKEAVEVIEVRGNKAYVRGTLRSGAEVIADGLHRIAAGTAVTVGNT